MFLDHIKGTEIEKTRILKEGEKRFTFILTKDGYEYKFEPRKAWSGSDINAIRRLVRQAYSLQKYSLTKRSI